MRYTIAAIHYRHVTGWIFIVFLGGTIGVTVSVFSSAGKDQLDTVLGTDFLPWQCLFTR